MRGSARLSALLLGLALAATYHAAAAAAAFHPDDLEMERAIQAGDKFWRHDPHNHCLGQNAGTIDKTFPARHADAAGYSVDGACGTIHVLLSRAERYTRSEFCVLVVHEYGHTINHAHVADPTSIMYPRPVTAGFHTKVCNYPDPHGTPAGETRTIQKEQPPPTPQPPRPLPLPKSFEIVWPGSADLWR